MFRQKLKGGHRVGSSLNKNVAPGSQPPVQAPPQSGNPDPPWDAWGSDSNAWNWDTQTDSSMNGNQWPEKKEQVASAHINQTQLSNSYQQVPQSAKNEHVGNGVTTQSDEWNTWDEWGTEGNLESHPVENAANNNVPLSTQISNQSSQQAYQNQHNVHLGQSFMHHAHDENVQPIHQEIFQEHKLPYEMAASEASSVNHTAGTGDSLGGVPTHPIQVLEQNSLSANALMHQTSTEDSGTNENWDWNADNWSDNAEQPLTMENVAGHHDSSSFNNNQTSHAETIPTSQPGSSSQYDNYTNQAMATNYSMGDVTYYQEPTPHGTSDINNVSTAASSYFTTNHTSNISGQTVESSGNTFHSENTQASNNLSNACYSSPYSNVLSTSSSHEPQSSVPIISVTEPSPVSTTFPHAPFVPENKIDESQGIPEILDSVNVGDDWEDGWDAKPESERCDMNGVEEDFQPTAPPEELDVAEPNVQSVERKENVIYLDNEPADHAQPTETVALSEPNQVQDHVQSIDEPKNVHQEFTFSPSENDIVPLSSSKLPDEEETPGMSYSHVITDHQPIASTFAQSVQKLSNTDSPTEVSSPFCPPSIEVQKLRTQSLSESRPHVARGRIRTVSESTEGDINVLKEELKDIFAAPTDLPDVYLPSEERLRTNSFSLNSQQLAPGPDSEEGLPPAHAVVIEHSISLVTKHEDHPAGVLENTGATEVVHVPAEHEPNDMKNTRSTPTLSPIGAIPTLKARHGSPFQPPVGKRNTEFQPEAVQDPMATSQSSVIGGVQTNFTADRLSEKASSTNFTISKKKDDVPASTGAFSRGRPDSTSPSLILSDTDSPLGKVPSEVSSSASEVSLTRMVPGQSSKDATKQVFAAPPAMPTDRVVTGNDNPQPMTSIRVKQEPPVRSVPDIVVPKTEPSSVRRSVRSETIGSEEPSIVPVVKDEKMGPPRHSRDSWDRESSSGDYYQDRDDRRYYKNHSPGSRHSYDSRYRDRRPRKYESDDEADDEEPRYKEGRERRRRGYRDYPDDRYYNRERHHDRRPEDYSRHYDDSVFSKHDRSRPSSRSSSLTNLENEGMSRDDYYDRPRRHREGSYRDISDSRADRKYNKDPFMRGYPQYPEHYGSRQAYDPSYYYYYQKYMEQHPYYRDYYKQYYGRNYGYPVPGEGFPEDKGSTRSGRSSVNEELKKSVSSHLHREFHNASGFPGYEPSTIYADTDSVSNSKMYMGAELSGVASVADEVAVQQAQRTTPAVFTGPHLVARFGGNGKLLLVLPNDPKEGEKAVVQVRDTQKMLAVNKQYQERIQMMKSYPGPLSCNDTHKDVVIRFCEEKLSRIGDNFVDAESQKLLWQYLALLVKHNGKICGADLASLLVQKKSTPDGSTASLADVQDDHAALDSSPKDEGIELGIGSRFDGEATLTKQFMEYLCLGRKKEAINYAIRQGLWGYAMTLAAKMDSVTQAKVMAAFINSMPASDPFQTLIQHLSGKRPEVTKSFSPDRWGDWREHLALLVSNPTGQLQRDQASIITLGDTLLARGQIHASHLCYLAADAPWGSYADKSSKIVLLGASHKVPFQSFMTEDAFQCSEVYEYAKSLEHAQPLSLVMPSYKLIYAMRLVECGFAQEALKYCEVMAQAIVGDPMNFEESVVSQFLELGTRLKYHDVHYQIGQGEITEMPDPEWLQLLGNVLYTIQTQKLQNQYVQEEQTPNHAEYQQPQETFQTPVVPDQPEVNQAVQPQPEMYQPEPVVPADLNPPMTVPEIQPPYPDQPLQNAAVPLPNADTVDHANVPQFLNQDPLVEPHSMTIPESQPAWQPSQSMAPAGWQANPPDGAPQMSYPTPIPSAEPQHERSSQMTAEEQEYWASMSNKTPLSKTNSTHSNEGTSQPKKKTTSESVNDKKDENKSGFFGSIFGWKKSNQAKLPDDSNPAIVWDDEKKRWVSSDGDEEPDAPPPPPPANMAPPVMGGGFRGGMKASRYVDPVMGKPAKPFSSAPVSKQPPGGIVASQTGFTPTQEATPKAPSRLVMPDANQPTQVVPQQQAFSQPSSMPPPQTQMPSQPLPPQNYQQATPSSMPPPQISRIRYSSESSSVDINDVDQGGLDPQTPVPMMGAPPMFNPTQFTKPTGATTRKGPGRRTFAQ